MLDAPPPITLFTFMLELPRAVPVPHETQSVFFDTSTPGWSGWPAHLVGGLLGQGAPSFPPDQAPGTRIVVRHTNVVGPVGLQAATEAFADWVEPVLSGPDAAARAADLEEWKASGFETVRSVIAITRFVPQSEHPRAAEMTTRWMRSLFETALADLNGMLEALGLTTRSWSLGTVTPEDLPALLPVLVQSSHAGSDGRPQGATLLLELHDAYPAVPGLFDPQLGPVEEAVALSNAANHGEQPFFLAFRYVRAAFAERLAGDPTRAVIDLNTAVEIIISGVLAEGGQAVGWDAARITRATAERTGLRNRLQDHLGPLVGEIIDTDDASTPWGHWWADGYAKRNAAVHRGVRITRIEADAAFDAGTDLVEHLTGRLSARDQLARVGDLLAISLGTAAPWEDGPLDVSFPWE